MSGPASAPLARPAILGAALCLGVLLTFSPILRNDFINFDDGPYVTQNLRVRQGLTWDTVRWAFTASHTGNWHPLTWLSHALDYQLFGLRPAGHHFTSLVLHTANTGLLFALLFQLTGATWRSLLAAALFGLHPLRVESVAWVAERKDVLSALFFLGSLWFYARFARAGAGPPGWKRPRLYALALAAFGLGLLSKPMVVTLPFVLLLLDYWPLQRITLGSAPLRVAEKLPFFALSGAACVATYLVQSAGGNTVAEPVSFRLQTVVVAGLGYLKLFFWPFGLAVFYPRPDAWPALRVAVSAAVLAAAFALVLRQWRSRGYLVAGWLWFFGMLVPVIGFVPVGGAWIADRYTYLPAIGLGLAVVWGLAEAAERAHLSPRLAGLAGGGLVLACGAATQSYLPCWENGRTLFEHALRVTRGNDVALVNVAGYLAAEPARARAYCLEALQARPKSALAWNRLARLHLENGPLPEALRCASNALQFKPRFADAFCTRGEIWLALHNPTNAAADFRRALEIDPDHSPARIQLNSLEAPRNSE